MMGKVYKRGRTYDCFDIIYRQGRAFGEAGKHLIESKNAAFFVPGMINICLATEIFLKSINASQSWLEDEVGVDGATVLVERDPTVKISPGGRGHVLSKLFKELPVDAKTEISALAVEEGWRGDVFDGLRQYDDVFVEWRYIYEKNDPRMLGTSTLFEIFNAINLYCNKHVGKVRENVVSSINDVIQKAEPQKKTQKKSHR